MTRPRRETGWRVCPQPHEDYARATSTKNSGLGGPAGSPNHTRRRRSPREPEFPAGGQDPSRVPLRTAMDKHSNAHQKTPEDLGSKAMEAWVGNMARGVVSLCLPRFPQRWTIPPNPKEILGGGEATFPPKAAEGGSSRLKTPTLLA